jgi:hypothetical protein
MIYKLTNPFYKWNIETKKSIHKFNFICLFEKLQYVKTFLS